MNVCTVLTENSFQCTSYKISQWKWIMNRLVILFSVISIGGFAMVSEIELSELQMYNNWFCNEQVHPLLIRDVNKKAREKRKYDRIIFHAITNAIWVQTMYASKFCSVLQTWSFWCLTMDQKIRNIQISTWNKLNIPVWILPSSGDLTEDLTLAPVCERN